MAPKFGNYLFRNLKSNAHSSSSESAAIEPTDPWIIEDQEIVLHPEDFASESATALNWAALEPKEVRVKLKQTDGLMEGKVTLAATVLRELYPGLVSDLLKEEIRFSLSLRSVVLQLQSVIGSSSKLSQTSGSADFDTPIAQVAREDDGFFKLERHTRESATKEASGSEDAPFFPLIREKNEPRPELREIPAVPVVAPVPEQRPLPKAPVRVDPFADLPKPRIGPQPPTSPLSVVGTSDAAVPGKQEPSLAKPLRRRGLERLQELFLTDDLLDAAQVAQSLRAFPKVKAVLILLDDGSVLGGELPPNYQFASASSAPALMRAVRDFGTALTKTEVSALTFLADTPISIFLEGRVCILVAHEGRGLLPGMRDRFTDIAKALDALYAPVAEPSRPSAP
ncbi:MAG: hypothetical protein JO271_15995 [Verrucomicrobia bacterium]|nr:hypothetical protein [Verrucomicrobiota bacterium]